MNPRDILDVADVLVSGIKEADWRSAVSRAYFAVFHAARRLLAQCGFLVPRGEQTHGYLWNRLANSGHPDVQNAGNDANHLRGLRNWADYDLDRQFRQDTAVMQVQAADAALRLLETVAAELHVRSRITETMKIYERDVLRQVTWRP
jgi:uncharacterized protein (UPF0332 family)